MDQSTGDPYELMRGTRAMRWLKPDPVPRPLIGQLLEAAVTAPNAGNRQQWGFIVVFDPDVKARVQHYYALAFRPVSRMYSELPPPPGMTSTQYQRQHESVRHLTEHFHEAPVWIVGCVDHGGRPSMTTGASLYPAIQNVLLRARSLGLGATLTTRHTLYASEVDEILGLPTNVTALAIVPIGFPDRPFGEVRRGAWTDVAHEDQWGRHFETA